MLRGGGRAKHSHGLLEAAYNETVVPGDGRRSATWPGDMRDLGLDILKRVAMGQNNETAPGAEPSQRPSSREERRPPSGEEALQHYPGDVSLKRSLLPQQRAGPAGSAAEPWWGEQADGGDVIVALGGWDGSRNLASFEEIRPRQDAWQVPRMRAAVCPRAPALALARARRPCTRTRTRSC